MKALIEAIKADRAAGTQGSWTCYADTPSTDPNWHIVTTQNKMRVLANVHIEPGNKSDEANARRITRVPEMEEAMIAQAALIAEMTEALRPFCFFDADHPKTDTTQRAWDIRYTDRFRDWIGFDDIEAARDALARAEEAQADA